MNNWKLLAMIFIVALLGCRDDIIVELSNEAKRVGDEDNWVVYREETKDIDEETANALLNVKDEVLIFSDMTDQLDQIESGDILNNNTMSDVAPFGFLRRVISKEAVGNNVIVTTEEATIEEAFEDFSFNWGGAFEDVSAKNGATRGFFDNAQFKFPADSIFIDIPTSHGNIRVGLKLEVNIAGDLIIKYEKENGVTKIRAGVDRFAFSQSKFGVSLGSEALAFELSEDPFVSINIPVGAIPVGPIILKPAIELRGYASMVGNVEGFIGLEFGTTPFRAIYDYDSSRPSAEQTRYDITTPTWSATPKISLQGAFRKDLGFGIGFAVSPYSSALMTIGTYVDAYGFSQIDATVGTNLNNPLCNSSIGGLANCFMVDGCAQVGMGLRPGIYGGSAIFGQLPVVGQFFGGTEGINRFPITQLEKTFIKICANSQSTSDCSRIDGIIAVNFCENGVQKIAVISPSGVNFNESFTVKDALGRQISNGSTTNFSYNQSTILDATGFDVRSIRVQDGTFTDCERTIFLFNKECAVNTDPMCVQNFVDTRDFTSKEYCVVNVEGLEIMNANMSYAATSSTENLGRCYIDGANSCDELGRLYTWEEAMQACPNGFALGSPNTWDALVQLAGGPGQIHRLLSEPLGDVNNLPWNSYQTSIDMTGFYIKKDEEIGHRLGPQGLGEVAYFWTGEELDNNSLEAWAFLIRKDRSFERVKLSKTFGASCRCFNQ